MTTQEAFTNLRKELDSFFKIVCTELKLVRFVEWWNKELEKWK